MAVNKIGPEVAKPVRCEVCGRAGMMYVAPITHPDGTKSASNRLEKPWVFWISDHRGSTLVCSKWCGVKVAELPGLNANRRSLSDEIRQHLQVIMSHAGIVGEENATLADRRESSKSIERAVDNIAKRLTDAGNP